MDGPKPISREGIDRLPLGKNIQYMTLEASRLNFTNRTANSSKTGG
jgi:hypothetical protein